MDGSQQSTGRASYFQPQVEFNRERVPQDLRTWHRTLLDIQEHRKRLLSHYRTPAFVKEVRDGKGLIFRPVDIHPMWDYCFPLWESNPTHMLQCMLQLVEWYGIKRDPWSMCYKEQMIIYDRHLDPYLHGQLWSNFFYDPYQDPLLSRMFNPNTMTWTLNAPGIDWRVQGQQWNMNATIETMDQLDRIGADPDVNYSLDRNTFHNIQMQCLARGTSIDLGVLQVVNFVNGDGYTYLYRSRNQLIQQAARRK